MINGVNPEFEEKGIELLEDLSSWRGAETKNLA